MFYIGIGSVVFKEYPIKPAVILWINFIMDTFASIVLASELPPDNYDILTRTTPFKKN